MPNDPAANELRLRTSVKAIIVEDGRLLTIRKTGSAGESYVAPGGTHEAGETLREGMEREVLEELGARVEVGPLVHVRDYIGPHHEFAEIHSTQHRVEFWFRCRLLERPGTREATHPDGRQIGVEWLPLEELPDKPFYPRALIPIIRGERPDAPVYLGDVN
jgi:ADP-ribose pyrophosphatase YjhB (NUDIX family)